MIEPQKFTGFYGRIEKHLPADLLWDRWRKAWELNQQYRNSYAGEGHQPLPVKAIEKFEELKTTNPNDI